MKCLKSPVQRGIDRGHPVLLHELWAQLCWEPTLWIGADWLQGWTGNPPSGLVQTGWALKVSATQVDIKLPIDQKASPVINKGTDILSPLSCSLSKNVK